MADDKSVDKDLNPDGTKKESVRAKEENAMNKAKRKLERNSAQWTSPEHKTLSGQEVFPAEKVTASQPNPEDNPELKGTSYDPAFKR